MALYKSLSNCRCCCCCASILLLINVTTHIGPTGPQSLSTSPTAANGAADVAQSSLCGWLRAAADSDAVGAEGVGDTFVVCCFLFAFADAGSTSAKNTKTADILILATGKKLKTNGFWFVVVVVFGFIMGGEAALAL